MTHAPEELLELGRGFAVDPKLALFFLASSAPAAPTWFKAILPPVPSRPPCPSSLPGDDGQALGALLAWYHDDAGVELGAFFEELELADETADAVRELEVEHEKYSAALRVWLASADEARATQWPAYYALRVFRVIESEPWSLFDAEHAGDAVAELGVHVRELRAAVSHFLDQVDGADFTCDAGPLEKLKAFQALRELVAEEGGAS